MTEFNLKGDRIDHILKNKPESIKRIKENIELKEIMSKKRVKTTHEDVKVFGMKNVNLNAILKDNIWDRSIFTTDKLCRMFLSCTLEQLKKYEKKKRAVPMNMLWIIMIMMGVAVAVILIIIMLPRFTGVGLI